MLPLPGAQGSWARQRPVVSSVESSGGKDEDARISVSCGGRGVMADENQPPALTSMWAMYRWVKGVQGHCWLREQVVFAEPGPSALGDRGCDRQRPQLEQLKRPGHQARAPDRRARRGQHGEAGAR